MQNHEKLNTGAKSNTLVIMSTLVLSSIFDLAVLGEWGRIGKTVKKNQSSHFVLKINFSVPGLWFFFPIINLPEEKMSYINRGALNFHSFYYMHLIWTFRETSALSAYRWFLFPSFVFKLVCCSETSYTKLIIVYYIRFFYLTQ